MNKTVQIIYDENQKQRVIIFQRANGSFGFKEEYFSEHEFEMCWLTRGRNISFFDTHETALREAYGRVDWLIGKEPFL